MKQIELDISPMTDWSVAGHLFRKPKETKYNITIDREPLVPSNLLIRLMDKGNRGCKERILLKTINKYTYKPSSWFSESYVHSNIPIPNTDYLITEFNKRIEELREEYNDLFMKNHYTVDYCIIRRDLACPLIEQILKEYDGTDTT